MKIKDFFSGILNKDFKLVEKWKGFLIASGAVVLAALIVGFVFLGLGKGFSAADLAYKGGYQMKITLGTGLDADGAYESYTNQIDAIAENLEDASGNKFSVNIKPEYTLEGSGDKAAIVIYYGVATQDAAYMHQINARFLKELESNIIPAGNFDIKISAAEMVATSTQIAYIMTAVSVILLSLTLIFFYLAFRFDRSTAFAVLISLCHNVLIMAMCMVMFRVEFGAAFIAAALITLVCSLHSNIIIFGRLRENKKLHTLASKTNAFIANFTVRETLTRTINTTLVTLVAVSLAAIIAVPVVSAVALPMVFGIAAGIYSALFVSPAMWTLIENKFFAKKKQGKKIVSSRRKEKEVEKLYV